MRLPRPSHKPDDRALATDEAVIGAVAAGVALVGAAVDPDEARAARCPCHEARDLPGIRALA